MSKLSLINIKFNFLILILLIQFIISSNCFFSQKTYVDLNWYEDTLKLGLNKISVPSQFYFELNTAKININSKVQNFNDLVLKDVFYEPLTKNEVDFVEDNKIKIDTFFNYFVNLSNDQNQLTRNIVFPAFVLKDNLFFKVIKVVFDETKQQVSSLKKRGFSNNSVLSDAESKWYRFRINKNGFFKITYSHLIALGVDPKKLGFNAFHIYGNASGVLPELNSEYKDLDLIQNTVIYQGGEDGKFDEDDAIVFYSNGPNKISFNQDSLIFRELNIYSDYVTYFLRISQNTKPKIIHFKDNNSLPVDLITNDYQFHTEHEIEDTSLVYAGKRWYGEVLDFDKTIEIQFDGLQTELKDLSVMISGATNARIYGSYLNVYFDEKFIKKISLPSVSSEYIRIENDIKLIANSGFSKVKLELVRNSPDTKFFLDKIVINGFKNLNSFKQNYLLTNSRVVGKGIVQFELPNMSVDSILDISNPTEPRGILLDRNNNSLSFKDKSDSLKLYVFYKYNDVSELIAKFTPVKLQNLHAIDFVDMIIVTPEDFLDQANELKQIHQQEGLRTIVVLDQEVYNEFSSGEMDPTAIKQFARCIYNKQRYNPSDRLKYLLLFGDGTFDYKNRIKGNNNFLPTYQFDESEDFLSAMVSDDYFGMMDDDESLKGTDLLDIGVGRMLISSVKQAEEMVNKIKEYIKFNQSQTDWRSKVVLIADDEEGGYFINNDTEPQSKYLKEKHPEINVVKLYSDAFQQISTAGGERYPSLNNQIDNEFYNGSLVVSYVGHGGPSGAAEERVISIDQISKYQNVKKLPLFMSSTCEFTKYDDPTRVSAGEVLYLNPSGGAIALMTTTRPVFFGVNTISGSAFFKNVLQYDSIKNSSLTFGEIFRRTKNQSGTSSNRRSFTLIGDPALKISYPINRVKIDSINKISLDKFSDTLKALSKVRISGHLTNYAGERVSEDGNLFLTLYDKSKVASTLGQNVSSPIIKFENQNSILFKGLISIEKGDFKVDFILPKDIDYSVGKGKISAISYTEYDNGIGYCDSFLLGGIASNIPSDSIGPEIKLSLDSLKQIENGNFGKNVLLHVDLKDESGINISSSGIGHQISLVIDDKLNEAIDLNPFYVSDKNTYQSGKIQFPITNLSNGKHNIRLKAWDVYNNSSEKELKFSINQSSGLNINRIFNYPNPFTTKTLFYVENHNTGYPIDAKIEIYTISGKLVREINKEKVELRSNVEQLFEWDGSDQYGEHLAKGVYIYRLTLSDNNTSISKLEKLVIF